MKILILTNYSNGLYLFRKELLEAFKNEGHEILVSVPFDENTHKLEEMGLKLINTPLDRHGINPFKDFVLPISIYVVTFYEYKEDGCFYSKSEAKDILYNRFNN